MSGMNPEARAQFEQLHTSGINAQKNDDDVAAYRIFTKADNLAKEYNDRRKRLDALNPAAKALWSMHEFDEAHRTLDEALEIAQELDLPDETAIVLSNFGRLAAFKRVKVSFVTDLPRKLREESVPYFHDAREMLKNHPHYYYRYANTQHGAPVAALAGDKAEAKALIEDGLGVAYEISPEPYDQIETYKINSKGIGQIALAAAILQYGDRYPGLKQTAIEQIR